MDGRDSAVVARAFGIGQITGGLTVGWWAYGPTGEFTGLVISALVLLTPPLLTYLAAKKLGPRTLAEGGNFDASCAALTIRIDGRPPTTSPDLGKNPPAIEEDHR
jgi:hypothetical protein